MTSHSERKVQFPWEGLKDASHETSRALSYHEQLLVICHERYNGHKRVSLGATISIKRPNTTSPPFSMKQLSELASAAFTQTRWVYPTIACRPVDGKMIYSIESTTLVEEWAKRTVRVIEGEGGWESMHENMSGTTMFPENGDFCVIYVLIPATKSEQAGISTFDVFLQSHPALMDATGIRTVLNEFLSCLADPRPSSAIHWGEEAERLALASTDLLSDDELGSFIDDEEVLKVSQKELGYRIMPDTGLPLYRPDITGHNPEFRGSSHVSHTFSDESFLPRFLAICRRHDVDLAAALHIAMIKAVHDVSDDIPDLDATYRVLSSVDGRKGRMRAPFGDRNYYINAADVEISVAVPCDMITTLKGHFEFWQAARYAASKWAAATAERGLLQTREKVEKIVVDAMETETSHTSISPGRPHTCPYYLPYPPGSEQFSSIYKSNSGDELQLVIDSYMVVSDVDMTRVIARSHYWKDKLILSLCFNTARNPVEKMKEPLARWVKVVEIVSKDMSGIETSF